MSTITALPVERDPEYGFWTHPAFDELCGDREGVPFSEFREWLDANGLESVTEYMDSSNDKSVLAEHELFGTFIQWQPESPHGDGWFIGSIHDTEDGPVCVWLREVKHG
ncbi:hypothetical protein ACKQC9_23480 [Klebsiella michiganensis]|uniref:hypothetical protein n=1 Tax=Klebsiella TaxID=570 RepID=UPI0015E4F6D0|nr:MULTISPECIES: hypothetical protein [Klebsiella]ELF4772648.1 hypothetical protein [Klebsiella michiganensis]QLO23703.1 hypothetical protein HV187_06435 [Klebsiella michiganensis]WRP77206.1 hypothetical protein VI616_12110 [Klebsiella pneumoniae]HDH0670455.1 hypothetical protein [Klebsiella michiganensis]